MTKKKTVPRVIKDSDLRAVREMLGGSTLDLSYLVGSSLIEHKMTASKGGDNPISDTRKALLVRFLKKYPNERYFPLPVMPDYSEFADLMEQHWLPGELSDWRRPHSASPGVFGPLLGVNSSAGYNWARNGSYDAVVSRLFWIITNLLRLEGDAGMKKWLDVVDEEARSRGKSLKEVIRARSWGRRDRKNRRRVISAPKSKSE